MQPKNMQPKVVEEKSAVEVWQAANQGLLVLGTTLNLGHFSAFPTIRTRVSF
jgi:hypothetical protein